MSNKSKATTRKKEPTSDISTVQPEVPVYSFTGTIVGRNHKPFPLHAEGHALPQETLEDAAITIHCPQLQPHEISCHFDSLPSDTFEIGDSVILTLETLSKAEVPGLKEAREDEKEFVAANPEVPVIDEEATPEP